MSIARILELTCWQTSPVDVEPLEGGITNRNYLVHDGTRKFVVRQCADGAPLGIDRRNERACHQAAAEIGVSPALVHHADEFLVSDFVAGKTLCADDLQDAACRARAVTALQQLHRSWPRLTGEMLFFSPFQTIRTYAFNAARNGAQLPSNLNLVLTDVQALEASIAPYRPVLCHNDLLPANLIDTGEAVWIVDWELAGMGHPLFDVAGLASNAALSAEQSKELLETYGADAPFAERELKIFQAMSLLREALWGAVQSVTSTLDVDYQGYADAHFTRYREARLAIR